jgi:hypothetical protein
MPKVTKPKVDRTRAGELVTLARRGEIRVPRFQRSFRWQTLDVVRLFDSLFRGYPIGNLLMWRRPAPAGVVEIGPLVVNAKEVPDALWVVDGQQRITSLVGALAAPTDTIDPKFRIFFDLRAQKFVSAHRRETIRDHWLPVTVALRNEDVLRWQREREWLTDDEIRICDEVVTAIRDYEIPMYVVEGDDERALQEIFDRLNTFGRRLKRAEVFQALHTVSDQMEPSGLAALAARVRGFGLGDFPDQLLMQSVLAIRGPRIDRDFRDEFVDDTDRHEAFLITEKSLGSVVEFLRDYADIPHLALLPYTLTIPVLVRFVSQFGFPRDRSATLLRRWIWRGAVTGVAPQGNTVGLRLNAQAIRVDPVDSADRLLNLLPTQRGSWRPDLKQTRLTVAQAKLNALGMFAQRPRVIGQILDGIPAEDCDVVDAAELMDAHRPPWIHIVPASGQDFDLARSVANLLIHPPYPPNRVRSLLTHFDLPPDVLASQCLDHECQLMLRAGEFDQFLSWRARLVSEAVRNHVQSHALFGFKDGPDLDSLFDLGEDKVGPDAA